MSIVKINWDPDAKALRQFGIGILLFGALLGGISWYKGYPAAAKAIWGACAVLGSLTLLSQTLGKAIYRGWMSVALVIGTVVSTLALGVVYYLILTPMGIAGRIIGRDPLRLKKHGTSSYFTPLAIPADKAYFRRLF
jgi:hypothetical protein